MLVKFVTCIHCIYNRGPFWAGDLLFMQCLCVFLLKDSVLVIPEDSYSPELLTPKALDKALDFINQCGAHGFHIEYVRTLSLSKSIIVIRVICKKLQSVSLTLGQL